MSDQHYQDDNKELVNNQFVEPNVSLPELTETEALCNDLKRILVRCEQALIKGDAKDNIEKLERWIESYRRGLAAAQKISDNGTEMLSKARDQLCLARDELFRLEDEGGNPPSKEQLHEGEDLSSAIQRIDKLLPVVEQSFQQPLNV